MKKGFVVFMVIMGFLLTGVHGRGELSEFPLVSGENQQKSPSIYGDTVIWREERDGTWGTYGRDLSTHREFHITVDGRELRNSKIYGTFVVGIGSNNGYEHIYGYDISTSEGFRMSSVESIKPTLEFFGTIAVWEDDRNGSWDIYGYDLSTRKEFQITDENAQQWQPAVSGDLVIWVDDREDTHIYGYDVSTGEEFQITTDDADPFSPAIYGDIVVWVDTRNFDLVYKNWELYGYNLSTQEEFRIATGISNPSSPDIFGDIVVWSDDRHGNWELYGYDLSTQEEFRITTDEVEQSTHEMWSSMVVWSDDRSGNYDVYGADLGNDCSTFIRQEGDFFLEKGKIAYDEKEYESALFLLQIARQNYIHAGAAEKIQECDEWIQTCQTDSEGICGGSVLLLIVMGLGVLGSTRKGQNPHCTDILTLNSTRGNTHKRGGETTFRIEKKDTVALTAVLLAVAVLSQSTGMEGREVPHTLSLSGSHVLYDSFLSGNEIREFCSVITASSGGTVLFMGNVDLQLGTISDRELKVEFFPAYKGYGYVQLGREWDEKGYDTRTPSGSYVLFNEKGLAVAGSGVPPMSLTPHPERPFSGSTKQFLIKAMRECSDVASVLELAQTFDFREKMYGQYHFADAAGDAVVISAGKTGELSFTRKDKGDGYLVSTNFNLAVPESGTYPCWRHETAATMLEKIGGEDDLTVDYAASILDAIHVEGSWVNTAVSY
ncbi:MAG: hypothetical protein HXS52_14095, partial [Theionarchaea archaeon]|nr:hypothetical protein [Theionarchaea archaeon]